MLLSHKHAFIYLKTFKTAGTSVEIYLEPACLPDEHPYEEAHYRDAVVSTAGVIGQRNPLRVDTSWFNHMSAAQVREQVGDSWERYLKFCCVRHPYDKVVSFFWMRIEGALRETLALSPFETVQATFRSWVASNGLPDDRPIYTIDDMPVVDQVIRFEYLAEDLQALCRRLGLPWRPERLGRYKGEFRTRPEPFSAYYDAASREIVDRAYEREFGWFGYSRQL